MYMESLQISSSLCLDNSHHCRAYVFLLALLSIHRYAATTMSANDFAYDYEQAAGQARRSMIAYVGSGKLACVRDLDCTNRVRPSARPIDGRQLPRPVTRPWKTGSETRVDDAEKAFGGCFHATFSPVSSCRSRMCARF
jgi:hypothetical protein